MFRAMAGRSSEFDIVAINDLSDAATLKQLLKYDSVHGRFAGTVEATGSGLMVNGRQIRVVSERAPAKLPWKQLGVDVALESTGVFAKRQTEKGGYGDHLTAGARKVILDYGRGVATVVLTKVELGAYTPGPESVRVGLEVGATGVEDFLVLAVRKASMRY